MTNNSLNISIPIKFDIKTAPRGMTDYDPEALSPEQHRELNEYKYNFIKENIVYLERNAEVRAITTMIIRMTNLHQPRNITEFVGKIFTRPECDLRKEINKIMQEDSIEYEPVPAAQYETWDY